MAQYTLTRLRLGSKLPSLRNQFVSASARNDPRIVSKTCREHVLPAAEPISRTGEGGLVYSITSTLMKQGHPLPAVMRAAPPRLVEMQMVAVRLVVIR